MYSFIMLPYIILSYFIIKTVVNTSSLLTFYIIIPILNKLNWLFYNNILLNVTLENTKIKEIVDKIVEEDDKEDDKEEVEEQKDVDDEENNEDDEKELDNEEKNQVHEEQKEVSVKEHISTNNLPNSQNILDMATQFAKDIHNNFDILSLFYTEKSLNYENKISTMGIEYNNLLLKYNSEYDLHSNTKEDLKKLQSKFEGIKSLFN